jgi:glycosidase
MILRVTSVVLFKALNTLNLDYISSMDFDTIWIKPVMPSKSTSTQEGLGDD